ncbi:DUF1572 family protein [Bacillus sp. EAC]|uniref:DUF1572 family protein n=1 Tax=Bacillus sp. EAC TaxID=1978338 RepID=UPI000B451C58|nr:DUF1572 family protein [Bacillus sp. EAC]
MSFKKLFLQNVLWEFRGIKKLGDRTMEQLNNDELHWKPSSESNNVALIVKHLSGNMLSRWTDFLTSDGEKSWRNRDEEFEGIYDSKDELLAAWEKGWQVVFSTIESLTVNDLLETITIRGEAHTVLKAINRQISHYSYHIGQIVYVGKQVKNEQFTSLSIPKGFSEQYLKEKLDENK